MKRPVCNLYGTLENTPDHELQSDLPNNNIHCDLKHIIIKNLCQKWVN